MSSDSIDLNSTIRKYVAQYKDAANFTLNSAAWKFTHIAPTITVPSSEYIVRIKLTEFYMV